MSRVSFKVNGRDDIIFLLFLFSLSSPSRKKRKEGYEENETKSQPLNVGSGGKNTCRNFKT